MFADNPSNSDSICTCRMFTEKGYCWHAGGYKPILVSQRPVRIPVAIRPVAIIHMERWVEEHREKHDNEDRKKERKEKR